VADKAASDKSQNIKALTDIGRRVCETAQSLDEQASIAGTSMDGSSYEWGLRIEMQDLNIEMNCKTNSDKPMTVKDLIAGRETKKNHISNSYIKILDLEGDLVAVLNHTGWEHRLDYCCVFPKQDKLPESASDCQKKQHNIC